MALLVVARERIVMLSATKHLGPASQMLRYAQHDKWSDRMTSKEWEYD